VKISDSKSARKEFFFLIMFMAISCEKKVSLTKSDDGLSAEEHIQYDAEADNNPADADLKPGKLEPAEKEAKAAIKYGNQNPGYFHLTYSEVLIARKDFKSACSEPEEAKGIIPGDPNLLSTVNELWEKNCNGG